MSDIGKYRGQRKDNGEWVYGNYCNLAGLSYISEYPVGTGVLEQKKCIGGWVIVIPETVGQCTGLKDKNGVESFFGDLIKIHDQIFEIKWDEKMGRVFLYGDGIDEDEILYLYGSDIINGEVVGNIHEGKK